MDTRDETWYGNDRTAALDAPPSWCRTRHGGSVRAGTRRLLYHLIQQLSCMVSSLQAVRSPQLDTILMVEDFIREHSGDYKRRALWEALPRRMMYQTFKQIIQYLLDSGKIALDRTGYVVWIHNPELFAHYHGRDDLRIR